MKRLTERRRMTNLGRMLRCYRQMNEHELRSMAKEVGVSAATLMRIEHGRECDASTLVKVLQWAMKSRPAEGRDEG